MGIVKRLDLFLLKTFLPLFVMTFGICLFIFLMQFLWQYVDEMVGKGISVSILAELFFYTALTIAPRALPLAVLFASLMTFGNLGERLELLSMKAAGVSLMRIMRPLTIFLVFVAIAAFFFQNNVIPISQVKQYTILFSVKQKSPELEIPERIFYTAIKGKNILVREKDKKSKILKDVMIYDHEEGFDNVRVVVADSGKLKMSVDKKHLILSLFSGESFQNLKVNKRRARSAKDAVPYKRESFDTLEMLIAFDSNFNMNDESMLQGRYIGKNIVDLQTSIDSMTVRLDSIKDIESKTLFAESYRKTLAKHNPSVPPKIDKDSVNQRKTVLDFDSLYKAQSPNVKISLLNYSKRKVESLQMNYGFKSKTLRYEEKEIRRHHTEMHRKFTLSFACLIFFFIGAPLGAIIRKGGLGAPAVISVMLFVVYYIIDNMGYKMARDGVWPPWEGMWLSSAVLLPLGVILTYKAVNDSVLLDTDVYADTFKRLIGKREFRKIEKKEVIIETPDYKTLFGRIEKLKSDCTQYLAENKIWINYFKFWKQGGFGSRSEQIIEELENVVEILANSDQNLVLNKTMDFPIMQNSMPSGVRINPKTGLILSLIFPIGLIVYFVVVYRQKLFCRDLKTTSVVCDELLEIIKTEI